MKVSIQRASFNNEKLKQDLNELKQYGIKGVFINEWPWSSEKIIVINNFRENDIWRLLDIASDEGLIIDDCRDNSSDYDFVFTIYDDYVE